MGAFDPTAPRGAQKTVALIGDWARVREAAEDPTVGETLIVRCPDNTMQLRTTISRVKPSWIILGEGLDDERLLVLATVVSMAQPSVKLAVLGNAEDPGRCQRWLDRGASAYLRSAVSPHDALQILYAAQQSGIFVVDELFRRERLARQAQLRMNLTSGRQLLTKRERDVLGLMQLGMRNSAIAGALSISAGAVEFHVSNILSKLDADSRTEAVVRANALGI